LALDSNNKLVVNNKAQMISQRLTCIQASISDKYATRICLPNIGQSLLKIPKRGKQLSIKNAY